MSRPSKISKTLQRRPPRSRPPVPAADEPSSPPVRVAAAEGRRPRIEQINEFWVMQSDPSLFRTGHFSQKEVPEGINCLCW
ncbi:hypothetical protein ACP70R_049613 [Stipagrostis hirtigluma subsp. patula]